LSFQRDETTVKADCANRGAPICGIPGDELFQKGGTSMQRSLAGVAVMLTALVLAGTSSAATQKLTGTTGPGFTITVKKGSTKVTKLKAGTYKIVVADKSSIHNFHLFGPGVNKKTSVPFVGTQTWTVKLKPGKYTYQCDIHVATGMKGTFTVSG
jgi:plastocyanin